MKFSLQSDRADAATLQLISGVRNRELYMSKSIKWSSITFSALAIILLQFITIPLMLQLVDLLFGLTWSMNPPLLAWFVLTATSIVVAIIIRKKVKPSIRNAIWFVLALLVVSFSCAVTWAGVVSSSPGY